MAYNPNEYWIKRGKGYKAEFETRRQGKYRTQVAELLDTFRGLEFSSVLEVGCGFGRMTAEVTRAFPSIAYYDAVDISPDQLKEAKGLVPSGVRFMEGDFRTMEFDRKYDLVFATEVLMHIPPPEIGTFVAKMVSLSDRYVVSLDFWSERKVKLYPHNFQHDYDYIYRSAIGVKSVIRKKLKSELLGGLVKRDHSEAIFFATVDGAKRPVIGTEPNP